MVYADSYFEPDKVKSDSLNVRFVIDSPLGILYSESNYTLKNIVFCSSGGGIYILNLSTHSSPVISSIGWNPNQRSFAWLIL